ncbi:MAG: energy transducer TonB [Pseudomonadota bacterium]
MNYVSQSSHRNPAAMLASIGIPGAMGALIVAGLAVTVVVTPPDDGPLIAITPTTTPPPPPKPTSDTKPDPAQARSATKTHIPPVRDRFAETPNAIDGTAEFIPSGGHADIGDILPAGSAGLGNLPPLPPIFEPVAAAPSNNVGNWVTNGDYKRRWVTREMTGTARFKLEISATGAVTNCAITRSTGHAALDQATCRLVTQRARFTPARDGDGLAVPGTYSHAIRWTLPD